MLAVLTAASLAACGSGGEDQDRADSGDASQAQESAGAVSAEPSEETKVQELVLGETTAVWVRETTITGFEFLEEGDGGESGKRPEDGKIYACLTFTMNNTGTEAVGVSTKMSLVYQKGEEDYTFEEFNTMYRKPGQGYWVGNGNTLDVLSEATECKTYFEVPLEVRDQTASCEFITEHTAQTGYTTIKDQRTERSC